MPEEISTAVNTATEGVTPSSAETQAEIQTTEPPKDWRAAHRADSTLNDYIQSQIAQATAKAEAKRLRAAAAAAVESKDTNSALDIAQRVASQIDPEDEQQAAFLKTARVADATLARLTHTDEYAQLWKEQGKAAMDAKWFADPTGYAEWVEDQVLELRAAKRADKIAKDLAKAMSADQVNEALKGLPQPIAGGGSTGTTLTYDQYLNMPSRDRIKLKKENPQLIDAMVARAAA